VYAVLDAVGCGDRSEQSATAIEHPFRPPAGPTYLHFSINWVNEEQAIENTDEVVAAEQVFLERKHDAFIDWLANWCSAPRLPIHRRSDTR